MGAFELNNDCTTDNVSDTRRLKEECIIALKVYDFCRQQDCLTGDVIGPARAAEDKTICGEHICEGEVIDPPPEAASVSIDKLKVKKVIVVNKRPNAFKNGFWDVDLKYVFVYKLTFREVDGSIIGCIWASSTFTKKITLFGSIGTDIVISTDLFNDQNNDSYTLDSDPFILVEANVVAMKRIHITIKKITPFDCFVKILCS